MSPATFHILLHVLEVHEQELQYRIGVLRERGGKRSRAEKDYSIGMFENELIMLRAARVELSTDYTKNRGDDQ